MKRLLLLPIILLYHCVGFAQAGVTQLVEEGIELHDKQEYDAALKKYDEALAIDSNHFMANYEKSYTLNMLKKHKETITICEKLNRLYPFEPQLKHVYVTWGSALDDMNQPEKSIEVYNKGLDEFPDFYLLHFNKGITYARMGKNELSQQACEEALKRNGLHGSSHNLLAVLTLGKNKIPSMLSSLTLLAIEPTTARASTNLKRIEEAIAVNYSKEGENKINVNININLLDTASGRANNFSNVELMLALGSALDMDDQYKSETKTARLARKLNALISLMWEQRKDGKGFFWEFYPPFFKEMQEKKFVDVFSHIAYASAKEKENMEWIDKNTEEVDRFYAWLKSYEWGR